MNPAKKCSDSGPAHRRVAVLITVVRKHVYVGFLPRALRVFALRQPPAVLREDDARVHACEQFGPLSDLASGRFNEDPISFLDTLFPSRFRVDLNDGVLMKLSKDRDLAPFRAEKSGYSP